MRVVPLLGVAAVLVGGVPASSATVGRAVPVSVAFWDARYGLAALSSFASCAPRGAGERIEIDRTADGGHTWTPVREACASDRITTAGSAVALLPAPGGLLRTRDRGTSWTRLPGPAVEALAFASSSSGWAVTGGLNSLSLLKTHDGGHTWHPLGRPCDGDTARISFVSRTRGWLLCLDGAGAGNQGKAVYETRDGGSSWRLRARAAFGAPAVGRLDSYGYPTDVAFRANGRGWMPQLRGATLTTADGGRTWTPLSVTAPEVKLGLSVSFVSDAAGFILVQNGRHRRYELDRTNDGGRTWHVVHAWPM